MAAVIICSDFGAQKNKVCLPLLPVSAGAQDHPLPSLQSPQGLPSLECVSKWRHSGGLLNDSVQEELEIKSLDASPEDRC